MTENSFVTVEERKQVIADIVAKYNKHLISPRPAGAILNNVEILAVAKCAREAMTNTSWDDLPATVCVRPGFDLYSFIKGSNCEFPTGFDIIEEKSSFLIRTVNAIMRHQHRLDEKWYTKTLAELKKVFLPDMSFDNDESMQMKCVSVFCEILTNAAASKGIFMNYLANDMDIPELPSVEEAVEATNLSPGPYEDFDFVSFLKSIRRESSVSDWSPFFITEDINMESPEWKSLSESKQKWITMSVARSMQPRICSYVAPFEDTKIMMEVMLTFYIQDIEKKQMKTLASRCEGVTRYQLETVASGYTGAVDCGY